MTYISISIYLYISINIYILLVQEEDCTMREAQRGQSLPIRQEDSNRVLLLTARLATGIELSIHSAISRAQLDALSPFNPLSEIRVALWRAHSIYDFAFMDVNIPLYFSWDWLWAFPAQLREGGQSPLSISFYLWKTHAMIFKSFLLKWNSDFRTISYKRMEIHHFAMKTT
ncbi:hypothetical protein ACJX0J_003259 [Zea mays]